MSQEDQQPNPDAAPAIVAHLDRRWWATPAALLVLAGVLIWGPSGTDTARLDTVDTGAGRRGTATVASEDPISAAATDPAAPEVTGAGLPAPVAGVVAVDGEEAGAAGGTRDPGSGTSVVAAGTGGDRRHCTADGRQHGVVFHAPPCVARWRGTGNGGATARGVTAETIEVSVLHQKYDAALIAAYEAAGYELATREEIEAFDQAAVAHLNKRLELYGRRIEVTSVFTQCGYPEDIPRCRESVREVIAAEPFAVVFSIGSYSQIFDDFGRAGIVTVGAHWFDEDVYARNRPFLHSGRTSATRAFGHVGEYTCKKLTGRAADRTGTTVHRTIGDRGEVERRFGLVVPEDPAAVDAARSLQKTIAGCDGGRTPVLATYTNDIATAAAQINSIALRFIGEGVTTVIPWNTSSASFLSAEATRQRWYPEWIVTGIGRMDEDENGQRMDPSQWQHAFGPAMSPEPIVFDHSDAAAMWRDAGHDGLPHEDTDRGPMDFLVLGWMLQGAGPELTAENAAAALLSAGPRGGAGPDGRLHPTWGFSSGDATAPDDAREVYFDVEATSPVNGEPGTYRSVDPDRRTPPGGWGTALTVPVARS